MCDSPISEDDPEAAYIAGHISFYAGSARDINHSWIRRDMWEMGWDDAQGDANGNIQP